MPIAEGFVKLLFEKMSSKLPTFEGIIGSQLTNWTNMLSEIEAALIDAGEKQLTDPAVSLWLDDLQDLAYDLDDVVDEFATEALCQKLMEDPTPQASSSKVWNFIPTCCFNFKPTSVIFNSEMRSKIAEITTRLRNSFEQCSQLNLVPIFGTTTPIFGTTTPTTTKTLIDDCRIYGREHEQKKIIELLLRRYESSRNNVDVIPIVGMAGIGKTSLARMVYSDHTVQEHFELKAWVSLSDEFDVMMIIKAIFKSVASQACNFKNSDDVQAQLKHILTRKLFLIVLDDVWNKKYSDWNVLKSLFNDGAPGSKVVVTTCNRHVGILMGTVELHDVEILSDDDCWSLFTQCAFEGRSIDANPNLEAIGKQIVKKCRGLPLAARMLGGLLRCKVRDDEWADVLHSKIWDLPHNKSDILPVLRLSYHHLPRHLKVCFAYCSIIPKGYQFKEKELVLMWMAEGFIQQQDKQMEDVGGEYFGELVSRSFFQPSTNVESLTFVMPDLINKLAQAVSRDTCFRLENELKDRSSTKI